MQRRRLLAALGAGTLGALAGCSGGSDSGGSDGSDGGDGQNGDDGSGGGSNGDGGSGGGGTPAAGDVELPVPESELHRGAGKDAIPAITDPVFASDWSDVDASLRPENQVIGVERDGEARAYPLAVLNWHEVVNDDFAGPLLVTYCPLCGSGVTAVRTVNGKETVFGVSGLLWRSDLVMYDRRTESLWSQVLATAIRGPKTGTTFDLVPSTLTTWGAWTDSHPDSTVLVPPPVSNTVRGETSRNYDRNPYSMYGQSKQVGIGYNDFEDDRLHPKETVVGVTHDGEAVAYPISRVAKDGVVNDTVGGLPVVVALDQGRTLVAYERRVDGETLTFEAAGDAHLRAGGSRWERTSGRAVDGPHEGTTLTRANDRSQMFWFAWAEFNPDTTVWAGGAGRSGG